ncbi:MAG: GNAT family N-acetyltransferase [Burkholderiaceae bacterium]
MAGLDDATLPRRCHVAGRDVDIDFLAAHLSVLPVLASAFEREWPAYYGPGKGGDAARDLGSHARRGSVPLGLVALCDGDPCGYVALKPDVFPTHRALFPWVGAAWVRPGWRRHGLGGRLFAAIAAQARALGHGRIYCATATADSLLERAGWQRIDAVGFEGEAIRIYQTVC